MVALNEYKKLGRACNVIYKIESPSGKVYIGKTCDFYSRINHYVKLHNIERHTKLCNSFLKYGMDAHTIDILCKDAKSEDLTSLEQFYIAKYDSFRKGLNCTIGGEGALRYSDDFCKELLQLNLDGLNCAEIGRLKNVKTNTVQALIRRVGTFIRHEMTAENKEIHRNAFKKYATTKVFPEFAKDNQGELRKVIAQRMPKKIIHLSEWHNSCHNLERQISRKKNKKYKKCN